MPSSSQNKRLFDPIRKKWVTGTPEEGVRQALLSQMLSRGGYPPSLVVVEQALHQMPHLKEPVAKLPDRRFDLVVYRKTSSGDLAPLLLVECKAKILDERALQQALGYNHYLGAPFVLLASVDRALTARVGPPLQMREGLLSYKELLAGLA